MLRKDSSPESYWVKVGLSEIRRNRKHLFVLNPDTDVSDSGDPFEKVDLPEMHDNNAVANDEHLDNLVNNPVDIVDPDHVDNIVPQGNPVVDDVQEDHPVIDNPVVNEPVEEEVIPQAPNLGHNIDGRYVTRSGRTSRPPRSRDMVYYE